MPGWSQSGWETIAGEVRGRRWMWDRSLVKSLPQRRTSILIGAVGGGAVAFFISFRITREVSGESLLWVALGVVIGALAMFLLSLVQLGADSRFQLLRDRFPNAVVVQTFASETLADDLPAFAPWLHRPVPTILVTMTLVFEPEGVTMWVGGREPSMLAAIPWVDVTEFGVGPSVQKRTRTAPSLDRIIISAGRDGHVASLLVGLERVDGFAPGQQFLPQHELAQLVVRVNQARKDHRSPVAKPDHLRGMLSSGLEPGITAWSARRVSRLARFPATAIAAALAFGATLLIAAGFAQHGLVIGVASLVAPVVGVVGAIAERRATRREAASGYTTLNGRELHLLQRHPITGTIVRGAGSPPLSASEFDALLGRKNL